MIDFETLLTEYKELCALIVFTFAAMVKAIDYAPHNLPRIIGRFLFVLPLLIAASYVRTFEYALVYKVLFWLVYTVIYLVVMWYIFTRGIKGKLVDLFIELFFIILFIGAFSRAIKALIELNG